MAQFDSSDSRISVGTLSWKDSERHVRESSTVQVLVRDEGNRTAVSELLADYYEVSTAKTVQEADVYLVEEPIFPRYRDALQSRIDDVAPVFLPVILVRHREADRHLSLPTPGDESDPVIVDDILEAPLHRDRLIRRLDILLARRRQSQRHRERERRIELLLDATRKVMETGSVDEVAQLTADVTKNILGYASNVVRLVDEQNALRPAAVTEEANVYLGERPVYPLDDDNPAARAFREEKLVIRDDLTTLDDEYDRGEARSAMYVPIASHGVISIIDPDVDAFRQSDAELASILAANAEAALDQIEYEGELRERELLRKIVDRVLRHNLRNDLNVIRGNAELLATDLGGSAAASAEAIIDTVEDLSQLSRDTRAMGKLIDRSDTARCYDLSTVVRDAVDCVHESYPEVTFETDIPDESRVRACEGLETAVEQLVENAAKHNDGDDPRVSVSVDAGDETCLVVADNGPGIPDQETLPLDNVPESSLDHASGTGLWMTRWVVDHSGGTLSFDSSESGTRLEITLPAAGTDHVLATRNSI